MNCLKISFARHPLCDSHRRHGGHRPQAHGRQKQAHWHGPHGHQAIWFGDSQSQRWHGPPDSVSCRGSWPLTPGARLERLLQRSKAPGSQPQPPKLAPLEMRLRFSGPLAALPLATPLRLSTIQLPDALTRAQPRAKAAASVPPLAVAPGYIERRWDPWHKQMLNLKECVKLSHVELAPENILQEWKLFPRGPPGPCTEGMVGLPGPPHPKTGRPESTMAPKLKAAARENAARYQDSNQADKDGWVDHTGEGEASQADASDAAPKWRSEPTERRLRSRRRQSSTSTSDLSSITSELTMRRREGHRREKARREGHRRERKLK